MSLRRIVLVLIVLIVVYGVFWHGLADRVEIAVKGEIESLQERGADIALGKIETSGFPYRFEISVPAFEAQSRAGSFPWAVSSKSNYVFTHPWTPGHYVARSQELLFQLGDLKVRAPESQASVLYGNGKTRLDADFGAVQIQFPRAGNSALNAARMQFHLMLPDENGKGDRGEDALLGPERADIALSLDSLGLGPFQAGAPAPAVDHMELRAELHGALPVPVTRESLVQWRDNGGTIEFRQIDVRWGQVKIGGEGSLTLDEDLRPLGALTLEVSEPGLLVRYLERQGLIDRDAAPLIREGVDEIAALGDRNALRLPVSVQDGTVFLGPIAIAEIPPLLD